MKACCSIALCLLLGSLALATVGCESGVDVVVGEERPFTLWGMFDAGADTQRVRVFTIEGTPGVDRSGGIDAEVVSTDLTTGERRVWIHREVTYEGGDVAHVYWSPFRAQHGHEYRLEVVRSDGAASTAMVTVPQGVEIDISVRTDDIQVPVTILGDAPNILGVAMRYEATNFPPLDAPLGVPLFPLLYFPVEVSYDGEGTRIDGGWRFLIDMQKDVEEVRGEYEMNCLVNEDHPGMALRRVEFHLLVASEAWFPPGGQFDPELLVQPGAFSNVENGYGFIGAGEIERFRWTPVASVRESLGFVPGDQQQAQFGSDPPIPCVGENAEDVWDLFF